MLSKEQANLKAEQLIQQDAHLNLKKIAKLNSFQLWMFKNKQSSDVPLDQQYFLLRIAKQNADDFKLYWKENLLVVAVLIVVIFLIIFNEKMFPNSNLLWFFMAFSPMILPILIRYLKVRNLYKDLLQTHLDSNIHE